MLTAAEVSALVLSIKAASLSLLFILPPGLPHRLDSRQVLISPANRSSIPFVMLPMVLPPGRQRFFPSDSPQQAWSNRGAAVPSFRS